MRSQDLAHFSVLGHRQRAISRFVFGPHLQLAVIPGLFFLALDASLLVTPMPLTFEVEALPSKINYPVVQWLFRLSIGFGSTL